MPNPIPLSAPTLFGNEWKYVKDCLDTGWVSTAGPFVNQFEADLAKYVGSKSAIACNSGTSALHIALEVAGVSMKDEVIVPTVTFIAPINAVKYLKADPVFMDCDKFYNLDIDKTIEFLEKETIVKKGSCFNKKTKRRIKAVIPVHVFGNAVNLKGLMDVCRKKGISVVEDATESLGTVYGKGPYQGKHTGTVGDFGCFSFNGNKIITAGGGGMIVTDNLEFANRSKYLTTTAKDDGLYFIHDSVGYNFRLNNIQAAIGVAQLEQLGKIVETKNKNYQLYKNEIDQIPGLRIADVPPYAQNNYWMYPMQINAKKYGRSRDELIKLFQAEKIEVRPLWQLNHLQKPYVKSQTYKIKNAYEMLDKTINIPCSMSLTLENIKHITGLLKKWKK